MVTIEDVRAFLDQFNVKAQIFGIRFRDDRGKNRETLLQLDITPLQRELIVKNLHVHDEIDRWILSKLNTLIREVRAAYEDYDVKTAGRLIETFVCDHVSNWYVRLNRSRFWNGDKDAFQTLYDVLMDIAVLAAPIAPFFMDQLYLDLTSVISSEVEKSQESVHYVLMPEADAAVIDTELEEILDISL